LHLNPFPITAAEPFDDMTTTRFSHLEIAQEKQVALAPYPAFGKYQRLEDAAWLEVDWTLRDADIARQLKVSTSVVFYQRRKAERFQRPLVQWTAMRLLECRVFKAVRELPAGATFTEDDIAPLVWQLELQDALDDFVRLGTVMQVKSGPEPRYTSVEQAPDPLIW
jgi:hypothetical protein